MCRQSLQYFCNSDHFKQPYYLTTEEWLGKSAHLPPLHPTPPSRTHCCFPLSPHQESTPLPTQKRPREDWGCKPLKRISWVVDGGGSKEATGGEGGEAVASASWLPVQACSPEPKWDSGSLGPRPISILAMAQCCLQKGTWVQAISLLI